MSDKHLNVFFLPMDTDPDNLTRDNCVAIRVDSKFLNSSDDHEVKSIKQMVLNAFEKEDKETLFCATWCEGSDIPFYHPWDVLVVKLKDFYDKGTWSDEGAKAANLGKWKAAGTFNGLMVGYVAFYQEAPFYAEPAFHADGDADDVWRNIISLPIHCNGCASLTCMQIQVGHRKNFWPRAVTPSTVVSADY